MNSNGKMKMTLMAAAMDNARIKCVSKGGNPGKVGHRVLTNMAMVGALKSTPAKRKENGHA